MNRGWIVKVGAVLIALLALYGGVQVIDGGRELYADWQFVRAARVQAIRQQIARQQQSQAKPAPAAPAAEAPKTP